jgi:hypothetical protein
MAALLVLVLSTGAELQAATVSAAMAPQNSFTNVFIVFVLLQSRQGVDGASPLR